MKCILRIEGTSNHLHPQLSFSGMSIYITLTTSNSWLVEFLAWHSTTRLLAVVVKFSFLDHSMLLEMILEWEMCILCSTQYSGIDSAPHYFFLQKMIIGCYVRNEIIFFLILDSSSTIKNADRGIEFSDVTILLMFFFFKEGNLYAYNQI